MQFETVSLQLSRLQRCLKMVDRKTASVLTIATLLACAIPTQSVASFLMPPVLAQAAPSFSVPDSVAKGTKLSVASSSDNMNAISKALGQGFEKQYSGSGKVEVTTTDANKAIQEVLNGNVDLAAISRPLSAEEKSKGLIEVPVRREKIAIVIGKDNPFAQSLTGSQFAQIFRGEIKDWSKVGGAAGPIKVIDRPDSSETRQALKPYPVFATAEFKTGATATKLNEDSTEALAKAIGKDGIGYALVSQLEGQSAIKAIELHKTLPDDPRYPFSQPYSFVYAGGASPAVAAFLGYATGSPGQNALNSADLSGYGVLPAAGTATAAAGNNATATADAKKAADGASGNATSGANGTATSGANGTANGTAVDGAATNGTNGNTAGNAAVESNGNAATVGAEADRDGAANVRGRWWWLLLPLAGLGLLLWAAGRRGSEEETGYIASAGEADDDRVRSSYRSGSPDSWSSETSRGYSTPDGATATAGQTGVTGLGKMAAGGAALAGGAAAAGAGLAGRMKGQAGDVTMDLGNIPGSVQGGIEGTQGSARSGLGNLRSNIQGSVQGSIDGARTTIQGGIEGVRESASGSFDGFRSDIQDGVDNVRGMGQEGYDNSLEGLRGTGESWLDKAKKRINEATDQIKDTAADIKDDITKQ
jgi:ABC-type phosphate transport system substrate-binding protein